MNRPRILIAGIGNLFQGDDYFGCQTAQRLAGRSWPDGVDVADFGIRGFDAAYALMDGYELAILVDTTSQGGEPGTVYVMELELDAPGDAQCQASPADGHSMNPSNVLRLVKAMGGEVQRLLLVGCEPADLGSAEEGKMGLSEPVAAAVDKAAAVIESLVADFFGGTAVGAKHAEISRTSTGA